MKSIDIDRYFRDEEEPVVWREDKSPHKQGSFLAVVFSGRADSTSAGDSRGALSADIVTVIASENTGIIVGIKDGDTLTRMNGDVLSVQTVTHDETGWAINCVKRVKATK